MRRTIISLSLIGLVLAAPACKHASEPSDTHAHEAVLTVGNRVITAGEFLKRYESAKVERGVGDDPEALAVLKETLLREMIQTELILGVARKKGIVVSHEEVAAEISRIRESYPGDTFQEMLADQYIAYDEWVDRQKIRLTVEKVLAEEVHSHVEVSEEEIQTFFKENADWAEEPAQVRVSQILVSTEAEARHIHARLEKGDDFAELAREKSISPEGQQGGELGVFSEGQLPVAFNRVFDMKPGQVSDVVQSEFGFHIFKVSERVPARKITVDEARPRIQATLRAKKASAAFQTWLKEVAGETPVMRNDVLLAAID